MNPSLDRESLAQYAPKLAALSQQILFDDIWKRPELSARDRSLVTLAILAAQGRVQQIPWHLQFARQNGLNETEITELFTHLAFYAGWPAAVSALGCLAVEENACR